MNKEARTTSTVYLLLTLNIFHILHNVKNTKIRAFYFKKERQVSLKDRKSNCFLLPNIPLPPRIKIHQIFLSYCINGILQYLKNLLKDVQTCECTFKVTKSSVMAIT